MEKKGWRKWSLIIVLSVIFVSALGAAIYFTLTNEKICQNIECFQGEMRICSQASYVNEDKQASWRYNIIGKDDGCMIKVTLLQAKQGDLGIDKLNGYSMICTYPLGVVAYPENDLRSCTGKLKEEMQAIVINKLHTYIINNLGELNSSIQGFSGL